MKSAISETDDLRPPAEVTILTIEVSTISAMIIKIMIRKIPVLPSRSIMILDPP
jgi:hypothetical protein